MSVKPNSFCGSIRLPQEGASHELQSRIQGSNASQDPRVNCSAIRRICLIICCVAEDYYKENKEKFHFDYEIQDWDEARKNLPPIDMDAFMDALADPKLGNT